MRERRGQGQRRSQIRSLEHPHFILERVQLKRTMCKTEIEFLFYYYGECLKQKYKSNQQILPQPLEICNKIINKEKNFNKFVLKMQKIRHHIEIFDKNLKNQFGKRNLNIPNSLISCLNQLKKQTDQRLEVGVSSFQQIQTNLSSDQKLEINRLTKQLSQKEQYISALKKEIKQIPKRYKELTQVLKKKTKINDPPDYNPQTLPIIDPTSKQLIKALYSQINQLNSQIKKVYEVHQEHFQHQKQVWEKKLLQLQKHIKRN